MRATTLTLLLFTCFSQDEEMSRTQLLNAPETILIEGHQLVLKTSVLVYKPEGEGAYGSCSIGTDSMQISSPPTMDFVWLVRGEDVWKGNLLDRADAKLANAALLTRFLDGPKWEPFQRIDVIVRIWHDGEARLLRSSNVEIRKSGISPD